MANNSYLTQQNIMAVKERIQQNTPIEAILKEMCLTPDQLEEVLIRLRHRDSFRAFAGYSFFDPSLCDRDEYIRQMGYGDSIITPNFEPLSIAVCSDLHGVSIDDKPKLVDRMYDEIINRRIKHIVVNGDVTEGTEYHLSKRGQDRIRVEPTLDAQFAYMNRFLPFDKSVIWHINQGNHDIFKNNGISIDFVKEFQLRHDRPDIVSTGIEDTILPINNDCIHLLHQNYLDFIKPYLKRLENAEEKQVIFIGHGHFPHSDDTDGYYAEFLPAMCDQPKGSDEQKAMFYMGFDIVTFLFDTKTGKFNYMIIEPFVYNDMFNTLKELRPQTIAIRRLKK